MVMKSPVGTARALFRLQVQGGWESTATKIVHKSRHAKVGIGGRIHHKRDVTAHTSGPSPFGHNGPVKTIRLAKPSTGTRPVATEPVHVLVADSGPIQSQLLTRALKSRRDFQASAVACHPTALHTFSQRNPADEVCGLVADGLPDRGLLEELGLSEHTIKKYLVRLFDKVGISSRVELVLYAMSRGEHRPAEWMPSSIA